MTPGFRYQETHSGLTWQLVTLGLVLPLGLEIASVILALTADPQWFIVTGFVPISPIVLIGTGLLYRIWPTGIRCDEHGLSTGAIRSTRAPRRRPTVNHQSWGYFSAPWASISKLDVVTSRAQLRHLGQPPSYGTMNNRWGKKASMTYCMIGVLSAPFMRAALVADVDLSQAQLPQVRRAYFYPTGSTSRSDPRSNPNRAGPGSSPPATPTACAASSLNSKAGTRRRTPIETGAWALVDRLFRGSVVDARTEVAAAALDASEVASIRVHVSGPPKAPGASATGLDLQLCLERATGIEPALSAWELPERCVLR